MAGINTIFGYNNVKVYKSDEITHISPFGLPVFMPLQIDESSYVLENKTIRNSKIIIPACIVEINVSKEIVKTPVMGQNGTVKEYIAMGDYVINIKGVLANDDVLDLRYPMNKVQLVKAICESPIALAITHELLNKLGIYELVIDSFNFPSMQGVENLAAFEISAVSDLPVELVIKNEAILR